MIYDFNFVTLGSSAWLQHSWSVGLWVASKHVCGIIFVFFVVHLIRVGGGGASEPTSQHVSPQWLMSVGESQNCFYSLVDTKDEGRLGTTGCWGVI